MKATNTVKTVFFLTVLTVLLVVIGNVIGGKSGALVALVMAGLMNFLGYWFSDKIVLKMYGAREIDYHSNPMLHGMVNWLALRAGLPMPKVYIIPGETPNAFATGRNPDHAAVAVTEGLLGSLSTGELEGVIGHELAHIKNRDILISSVVATIAGAIAYMAHMAQWAAIFGGFGRHSEDDDGEHGGIISALLMAVLAPVMATLIQLAISRSREFLADRIGSEISGKPVELANALIKLEDRNMRLPMGANRASAHLFIVSPLSGNNYVSLFRTHPSTEERVRRLREYSADIVTLL